ncbi:MAG TPA: metallophosphoesterase [Bacteroidales bacterium]|nr:metallophosphoesterase [Bacteroidales bacterium]
MNSMKAIFILMLLAAGQIMAQDIILLHSNDLHSKLNGYSPETEYTPTSTGNDETRGGFARIAGLIRKEKSTNNDDIVLAVDAGDFLMGSLFHPLEPDTGFQLRLMHDMGYDYLTIGNHEFDYGPEVLAQIINKAREKGDIPQLLLTNVEFDDDDPRDDALESLYEEGVISPYVIHEEKGHKIAFLGIFGEDAEEVQPYLMPVSITNPIRTAQKTAKELKKSGKADVVVVLSHSGVTKENGEWGGEDVKLADKSSKWVDAVISGHTHTTLTEPVVTDGVPVVQTGAGGQNMGRLVLSEENDLVQMKDFTLIPLDDEIKGISKVQDKINRQQSLVQSEILDPLGIEYDKAVFESDFEMSCEETGDLDASLLGPFIADAIQYNITSQGIHSDVSLVAAGVIRDRINPGKTGKQGIADIFRICSLGQGEDDIPGYALAQVHLTAKELKKVIEVLYMVRESSPSSYIYYSGIRIHANPDKGFLNKIQKIELGSDSTGWKEIDLSKNNNKLYAVSANAYMLEFLGMIKQKTFGLVRVKPKLADGSEFEDIRETVIDFDPDTPGIQEGKEWLSFYRYATSFPDTDGNGIPDIPEKYRTHTNPVIEIQDE